MENLFFDEYDKWLDACLAAGIPAMTFDDCCRLIAITGVLGGSMQAFTSRGKLLSEIKYAQKRLGITGGSVPDMEGTLKIQGYIRELEEWYQEHLPKMVEGSPVSEHPQWVADFMTTRYGIAKLWI